MTYTKPRFGAIALGLLCAAGAGAILLADVRHTKTITTDHLLSIIVLVGTIAAGHIAWGELRALRPLRAAGLALLFAAGSLYCVTSTAERTAELRQGKALAAKGSNAERAEIERQLAQSRRWIARSLEDVEKECASGDGKRCQGRRATLAVYQAAEKGHIADLAKLPAELPVNTKLRTAAEFFSALPYVTTPAADIERRLAIIDPLVPALFLELGSIIFFSIGLGHGRKPAQSPAPVERATSARPPVGPSGGGSRRERERLVAERARMVAEFESAYRARHGRNPRHAETMRATGLSRAATTRYRQRKLA